MDGDASSRSATTRIESSRRPIILYSVQTGVTVSTSPPRPTGEKRGQATFDRLGHRDGLRDAEADGRIDVDPGGRRPFDRGDPRARGRELDLHVRGEGREPEPLLEHQLGVAIVRGVRLERQPALAAAFPDEDRLEHAPRRGRPSPRPRPTSAPSRSTWGWRSRARRPAASSRRRSLRRTSRTMLGFEVAPVAPRNDRIRELIEGARVVPVVGGAIGDRPQERAVDEVLLRQTGHRVDPRGCSQAPVAIIIDDR